MSRFVWRAISSQLASLLLVMAVLLAPAATAQQQRAAADIEIDTAALRAEFAGGRYGAPAFLDLEADIVLPDAVRDGLDSGVPLEFLVELEVREPRRIGFARVHHQERWRYSLIYFELTRHYRLQAGADRVSRNYRSLLAALEALGTLKDIALEPGSAWPGPAEAPELEAAVRIRLDTHALPLPLQPLLWSEWRVRSREFAWPLY